MDYMNEYNKDLNSDRKAEYQISIADFTEWLDNSAEGKNVFRKMMNSIETEQDIYSVAFDFSIFVSMVKFFRKNMAAA